MTKTMRIGREAVLWTGGALGSLCLLMLAAGWLFNVTPLVFSSGSMSPAYEAGALGVAHEVPSSELAVGDVVSVLNAHGDRVTHRIVSVTGTADGAVLTLQGDTNNVPDAEAYNITSADRVAFGVPYAGYVLNAATSPFGLIVIALLVGSSVWLGFGRREDPEGAARGRARVLVPMGVTGVVLAGTALGATGQAPWAFTSAYWTDTATVTATASAPAGDTIPPTIDSVQPGNGATADSWLDLGCNPTTSGTDRAFICVNVSDTGGSGLNATSVSYWLQRNPNGTCFDGESSTAGDAGDWDGTCGSYITMPMVSAGVYRTLQLDDADMLDAVYTLHLRAVDVAGNVTLQTVTFTIDGTGPAFGDTDPHDGQSNTNWTGVDCDNAGGTERICADITDVTGVATVTFRLVRTTGTDACWNGSAFITPATAPACTLSMTLASGSATNGVWWSAVIPSSQMNNNSNDIDYDLVITATDAVGNVTTTSTIDFEITD